MNKFLVLLNYCCWNKCFLHSKACILQWKGMNAGNVLFNNTLNTFFIYGYMTSDILQWWVWLFIWKLKSLPPFGELCLRNRVIQYYWFFSTVFQTVSQDHDHDSFCNGFDCICQDLDVIFSNIIDVYEFTAKLLSSVEDQVEVADPKESPTVGTSFEDVAEVRLSIVHNNYLTHLIYYKILLHGSCILLKKWS